MNKYGMQYAVVKLCVSFANKQSEFTSESSVMVIYPLSGIKLLDYQNTRVPVAVSYI